MSCYGRYRDIVYTSGYYRGLYIAYGIGWHTMKFRVYKDVMAYMEALEHDLGVAMELGYIEGPIDFVVNTIGSYNGIRYYEVMIIGE